jgi:hypothetical protein
MKLRQRFVMHARIQGGALYGYNIIDEADRVVGHKSIHINKKTAPWKETATYTLGDLEFTNAADFRKAYEAKIITDKRDAEWDAAAPKEKP